MADLGSDLECRDDLTPELRIVDGENCLLQDLVWRLKTPRGGLFYRRDYGTDLRAFLHAPITNPAVVASAAQAECLKDPRVNTVRAEATRSTDGASVTCSITGTTDAGPFGLVALVTALDVALLSAS